MKYITILIFGSLFLGLIATLLSGDLLATKNIVVKIFYGLGVAMTPWVCGLLLASVKILVLKLTNRKIRYGLVYKFDVGVFLALSFCVHLGLVSLPG